LCVAKIWGKKGGVQSFASETHSIRKNSSKTKILMPLSQVTKDDVLDILLPGSAHFPKLTSPPF
jgi:hypothetical protein